MSSISLSFLLIFSTILIKNWRIFQIFHNPSQQDRKYLSNTVLYIWMVIICAPVIIILILIHLFKPLKVYQVSFPDHNCPGYPDNIESSLIEDHCIEASSFGWGAAIPVYFVILLIMIIYLGSWNCRITRHYKSEGELAILTATVSIMIYIFNYGISLIATYGYTEAGMIKFILRYSIGTLFVYFSFILAALYGFKVVQLLRDKKAHSRPVKRSRSTLRKKFLELSDEIFTLKCKLEKMNTSAVALEQ
ncbi:PREDICTED: uncharacterized protein LOC105315548 [Amphimedon queenslandica]|nr:PREDICTED: uncharacterized protein LOC105315548 [Amphimedon queenslandica]|eukprot:XP_019862127.1 PREDICTED: uncharacterized protein LOC105315548 [Amphimedon queenslandica]